MFNGTRVARILGALVLVGLVGLSLGGCPWWPPTPDTLPADDTSLRADGSKPIVSVMIDAEIGDPNVDGAPGLTALANEMLRRQLPTTVYVTAEYANAHATQIQELSRQGFEIALHGYSTAEQLATMTYDDQKDLLRRALSALRGCAACGTSIPVTGFRPQYFSQNDDTYAILDELGLTYDSGFKAGHLPFTGQEAARVPVAVAGHTFAAVPVTTIVFGEQEVYLCDISCALAQHLGGGDWLAALNQALQEARDTNTPLVANFHNWYTGDRDRYDYFDAFTDFLDAAEGAGAAFVRSAHLVQVYTRTE